MTTIKTKAKKLKNFVVEYKGELALIIGGTLISVSAMIALKALSNDCNEKLANDPALREAWEKILSS